MIFVTVGTHEQQFNRLVEYMDKYSESNPDEEVVIQSGFSTYEPKHATWSKLYPYQQMLELVNKARIVITHGGPSSFIMPLQIGKVPIVVPRRYEFDEHVNNHQIAFCRAVAKRQKNIIIVEHIEKLKKVIVKYDVIVSKMQYGLVSNNDMFCKKFEVIIDRMLGECR